MPVRPRHDGWSPRRRREFIDLLVVTGCVSRSARAVGRSRQSAHNLPASGRGQLQRAWDKALASGRSYQLHLGIARCLEGERRPVMYRGRKVGEIVRHDNSLVIAVLKARGALDARDDDDPLAELDREIRRLRGPGRRRGAGRRRR